MAKKNFSVESGDTLKLLSAIVGLKLIRPHAWGAAIPLLQEQIQYLLDKKRIGLYTSISQTSPKYPATIYSYLAFDGEITPNKKGKLVTAADAKVHPGPIVVISNDDIQDMVGVGSIVKEVNTNPYLSDTINTKTAATILVANVLQFFVNENRPWNREAIRYNEPAHIPLSLLNELYTVIDTLLVDVEEFLLRYPTRLINVVAVGTQIEVHVLCDYRVYMWTKCEEDKLSNDYMINIAIHD